MSESEIEKFDNSFAYREDLIDFLEWCADRDIYLCQHMENVDLAKTWFQTVDDEYTINEYFDINNEKLEEERQQLLEQIRELNSD